MSRVSPVDWPEGKAFAFSIFDDPDAQSLAQDKEVYSFLADLGFRTTKGVWPLDAPGTANSPGETCGNPRHREWLRSLQKQGFELGYHNGAPGDLERSQVIASLDAFRGYFGADPVTMANHYNRDAMYWGPDRLSSAVRYIYLAAPGATKRNKHSGHIPGSPYFWGDVCRARIRYCRNFVFDRINSLMDCSFQPYHDPERSFVNYWFTSTEGTNCRRFLRTLREENQDLLEQQGGACMMYTHFGHGYFEGGKLNPDFKRLMTRLAAKNGWFVPVAQLLDFLRAKSGHRVISPPERARLERRWIVEKLFKGTT